MAIIEVDGAQIAEREINGVTEYAWDTIRIYRLPVECYGDHITNMYLIVDNEITLVDVALDTPQANKDLKARLETLSQDFDINVDISDVTGVIISHGHADHWGMLSNLRFKDKKVYIHEADTRIMKDFVNLRTNSRSRITELVEEAGWNLSMENLFSLDGILAEPQECEVIEVRDGQKIISDYEVFHVPGHSPGHICLKIGPILLLGDLILSQTTPLQIPGSMLEGCGLRLYLNSLRRMGGLGAHLGLPAHEETIRSVSDRVIEMEAFHYRRLMDILQVCAEKKSLFQITSEYYQIRPETLDGRTVAELSRDEQILALEEIKAHLEYLMEEDKIAIASVENGVVMYHAK